MSPFENAVASDHLPGVNWTAPGKPDGCLVHLVMHTPENTDGGTLAPSDRPQDDEGTSQTGAPIGLGIPLPEVMLMCSPMMTIPVRQRDTRSAAWPRVTFVVRREPTVELSPSRDQLYCSLSGLSRHNSCSAHTLEAAANRSSGCTVLGNDINRRPAV